MRNSFKDKKDKNKVTSSKDTLGRVMLFGFVVVFLTALAIVAYTTLEAFDFDLEKLKAEILSSGNEDIVSTTDSNNVENQESSTNILVMVTANYEFDIHCLALVSFNNSQEQDKMKVSAFVGNTVIDEETMRTFEDVLCDYGVQSVCDEFEKFFNIEVDKYVKIKQSSFEKMIDNFGGLDYTVPKDLVYNTDELSMHIQGGSQTLTGATVLQMMRYPEWDEGLEYKVYIQAKVFKEIISQFANLKNAENIENVFQTFINLVSSDISITDFMNNKDGIVEYFSDEEKNIQTQYSQGYFDEENDDKFFVY